MKIRPLFMTLKEKNCWLLILAAWFGLWFEVSLVFLRARWYDGGDDGFKIKTNWTYCHKIWCGKNESKKWAFDTPLHSIIVNKHFTSPTSKSINFSFLLLARLLFEHRKKHIFSLSESIKDERIFLFPSTWDEWTNEVESVVACDWEEIADDVRLKEKREARAQFDSLDPKSIKRRLAKTGSIKPDAAKFSPWFDLIRLNLSKVCAPL